MRNKGTLTSKGILVNSLVLDWNNCNKLSVKRGKFVTSYDNFPAILFVVFDNSLLYVNELCNSAQKFQNRNKKERENPPNQREKKRELEKSSILQEIKRKMMLIAIFELAMMRRVSFLVFILCILISFKNQNADTKKRLNTSRWNSDYDDQALGSDPSPLRLPTQAMFLSVGEGEKLEEVGDDEPYRSLEYDFYRDSCPRAEDTVRAVVRYLYKVRSDVAPALLRLAFHDCFIEVIFLYSSWFIIFVSFFIFYLGSCLLLVLMWVPVGFFFILLNFLISCKLM